MSQTDLRELDDLDDDDRYRDTLHMTLNKNGNQF